MDTVLAADCAYPFDYGRLPDNVPIVLGYVGSPAGTPNVWEGREVEAVRSTGRVWAPIWTPAESSFSAQLGRQAGNGMVAALAGYRLIGGEPVFLDIEKHVYDANPHGCREGVAAWQEVMHSHGHRQAFAYLPAEAETQWVADWIGAAPHHFAPGVIGVQYAGEVDGGRYDLSIFSRSVFADLLAHLEGTAMTLDKQDQAWIVAQLDSVAHNIGVKLSAYQWDNSKTAHEPHANVHIHEAVLRVEAAVKAAHAGAVDVKALAEDLSVRLGPKLAGQLATELAHRLSS